MIAVMLLESSVCHSEVDRVKTNTVCSKKALLVSLYLLLISRIRTGLVSVEHACFSLQKKILFCNGVMTGAK
jgi:hypothetical protein